MKFSAISTLILFGSIVMLSGCLSGCNDPQPSAAQDLMNAFGSACVTTGTWSQLALSHSQAIKNTLSDIRDNDPCKPFQATLDAIGSASQQIQALLKDPAYVTYRTDEEQVQDLTLALKSASPDSNLGKALQNALVDGQVSLAKDQAAYSVDQSVQQKNSYVTATASLASYVQQMISQAGGLSACLQQSPSVAIELATNLTAIGGSFISPVIGAGAQVIGTLLNFGVEYARKNDLNQALQKLDQVRMPHAMGCAMEAMSELYCDAVDSETLLSLAPLSHVDSPIPDFWQGMDILTRRMPALDNWLFLVRNGVPAQNTQDAEKQNEIWQKMDVLDRTYRSIYGLLLERKKTYDNTGDDQNKVNVLVKAIMDAVSGVNANNNGVVNSGQTTGSNPFSELSSDPDTFACWLALDPSWSPPNSQYPPGHEPDKTCPSHIPSTGDYGESYVRNHLSKTSFENLVKNWNALRGKMQDLLKTEFEQNITADPAQILGSAKKPAVGDTEPYEALVRLQSFIRAQLVGEQGQDPNEKILLDNLMNLVSTALKDIDDQNRGQPDRVQDIFTQFDLEHGLQKFDSDVNEIVQWDLNARVKAGQFPSDLNEILVTSGADVSSRLEAAGLRDHTADLSKDLTDAEQITTGNLEVFRDFFTPSLRDAIQYLSDHVTSTGEASEGPHRPFGQALGHLCTMVLQTGMQWPGDVSWDICKKATYSSPDETHPTVIRVADLSTQLQGKDYRTRVCAFHRFLRATRYAEIYSQPPNPPGPGMPGFLGFFIQ